ncbi:MAG: hypothetical protein IT373_03595 [Polyangiaceae bacterium]|nr:hypothetical protein [Polyangiaceae bacterium]
MCCAAPRVGRYACIERFALPELRWLSDTDQRSEVLDPCIEALGEIEPAGSRDRVLAQCDDSFDCAADEACCAEDRFWGDRLCTVGERKGQSVCAYEEVCRGDESCRAANARCVGGKCRRAATQLSCGGATCGDATPDCCSDGSSSRCGAPPDALRGESSYSCGTNGVRAECRSSSDCLAGEVCCARSRDSTYCARTCREETAPICSSDADCRELWIVPDLRPSCTYRKRAGVSVCMFHTALRPWGGE